MTFHVCNQCQDPHNPVTPENGGTITQQVGGFKTTLAHVHNSCKEAWAQAHGGTTFDALKPQPKE